MTAPRFSQRTMCAHKRTGVPTADHTPPAPGVSPERAIDPTQTRAGPNQTSPCERCWRIIGGCVVARSLPIARQRHSRPVSCFLSGSASWQPQTSASLFPFHFLFRVFWASGYVTWVRCSSLSSSTRKKKKIDMGEIERIEKNFSAGARFFSGTDY